MTVYVVDKLEGLLDCITASYPHHKLNTLNVNRKLNKSGAPSNSIRVSKVGAV